MNALVTLLVGSALIAADPAPEALSGDLAQLQGTWTTQAGTRRKLSVVLEVHGRCARVRVTTPLGQVIETEGELTLDPTSSPKALDWRGFHAPDGSELAELPGIYRIEGNTFTVRNGGFNDARPTEFVPGDGPLADVVTFQRVPAPPAVAAR